jgi:NAD(P)-dependent dehydrogenase (short-subunit alcohol dehydrogenase family)
VAGGSGHQSVGNTPEKRAAAAERHPLKTIGTPDEVARAALWLLEDARLTTGQVLNLDGGLANIR